MNQKISIDETGLAFLAYESALDAVFVVVRSMIVAVNRRAEMLLGTPGSKLKGRSIIEIFAPLVPDENTDTFEHVLRRAEERGTSALTTSLLRENDSPIWAELAASRVEIQGAPLLVSVRDVTERHLSSELLERERQFVARVINDFPAIICGTDADGMATFVNAAAATITGYDIDELVGAQWWELLEPAPTVSLPKPAGRSSHLTTPKQEIEIRCKDGSKRTLEWSEIVRYNDEGQHVETIGLGNDITRLRSAASEMERAKNAAEIANRAMGDFLANMTHELRTPMNGVIGMASLLLETNLTGQQSAYVETIRQCGAVLMKLINEILELTSIESGKIELSAREGDIDDIVRDLDAVWRPKAEEKELGFHWKLDPRIPESFRTDFERVRQVLSQLIANAVKFTREGGVTVCVSLKNDASAGPCLRFVVEDTGIGIPAHARPHLFEKFYQADTSTTRQYGGAGLGLTVAKNLVELMGGELSARSEENRGSRFVALIPIRIGGERTDVQKPRPGFEDMKILEDLDLSREVDLTGRRNTLSSNPGRSALAPNDRPDRRSLEGLAPQQTIAKGVIALPKQLPVLVPKALLERLGGNEQLCKQLYEMFAQTVNEKIPLIEATIEKEDLSAAAVMAHQFGGSCATVDAQRMRAHVIELEKACLANDLPTAIAMIRVIRDEAVLVEQEIAGLSWA